MSDDVQNNGKSAVVSPEPLESDPCMSDSKNKQNVNIFEKYREKIREESGLSLKGVYIVGGIIILAFLLLVIVIALSCAWPRLPHEYQYPICTKPECLLTSAQVSLFQFSFWQNRVKLN